MRIRTAGGAGGDACECASLLEHWSRNSGERVPVFCPAEGCMRKDLAGVRVFRADSPDREPYILPLCGEHGVAGGEAFAASDSHPLVPARACPECVRA